MSGTQLIAIGLVVAGGLSWRLRPGAKAMECAMYCGLKKRMSSRFAVLLFLTSRLFGQSAPLTTQPATFHIEGKITRSGATTPSLWVTFEGKSSKTVMTNEAGVYRADLPLGIWSLTVQPDNPSDAQICKLASGKTCNTILFRRPPFRVTTPTSLVFDISLPLGSLCDIHIVTPDGRPATPEEEASVDAFCAGEQFFPVPSTTGVPFEVHVWGGSHGGACAGERTKACRRDFATYNFLSVQGNLVVYDPLEGTLKASGDVVIEDESGKYKRDSISFRLENGRAISVQ